MNNLCVLLMLMWFSNWLVTSYAIPINIKAGISFNIDTDDLELSKGNTNIWLRVGLILSKGNLKTRDTPGITTATPDRATAPPTVATTTVAPVATTTTTTALPTTEPPTTCKGGFSRVGDRCYHFSTTKATFNDASIACHSLGAALAHPMNSKESKQLADYMRKHTTTAIHWWIGATDRDNEGQWVWAHDNTPVGYSNWSDGEPSDGLGNEDCAHLRSYDNYKWNDAPCNNKLPYVCQQGNADDDSQGPPVRIEGVTTTAAPLTVSTSDFIQLGKHIYYFSTTTASFEDASKACQSIGTALAHPQSEKDNSLIKSYIRNHKGNAKHWWIGATDQDKEGQWVWVHDKSPLGYSDWSYGEPNDGYENEDCAQLRSDRDHKWNDVPCENRYHYICQSEDSKEDSQGEPSGEMELSTEIEDEIHQSTISPFLLEQLYPLRDPFRRGYPWDTRPHYGRSFGHYA